MERNPKNPDILELYRLGIPTLRFTKVLSLSSTHTSSHTPVDQFRILPFNTLSKFNDNFDSDYMDHGSQLLNNDSIKDRTVSFANENEIQELISLLLRDIIRISGEAENMKVKPECSYTNETGSRHATHKADHWIVYINGRPVTVCASKSPADSDEPLKASKRPRGEHILDNVNVLGQIYDYILNLRSFHGQNHIFAIIGTMKDFRIVWLPHSDARAASEDLEAPPIDIPGSVGTQRVLHCSRIIAHDDTQLPKLLISAILKSAASTLSPVQTFSGSRMYIMLKSSTWEWARLSVERSQSLHQRATLSLTPAAHQTTAFTIIKSLLRTPNCKVWVCIAGSTNRVVVVKQMDNEMLVTRELDIWRQVNQQTGAFSAQVNKKSAIVMPYVVLAEHNEHNEVFFKFDFNYWSTEDNATAGATPVTILRQLQQLHDRVVAMGMTVQHAANEAANRLAAAGFMHTDLEWRHVGIAPVIDESGEVTDVLPVLVDFNICESGVDFAAAMHQMQEKLAVISEGVTFI